ncbi:hypothetical protein H4R35_003224 [Dimargaris xerosporica]|nr:hypothetical protein H4R35_003224 [Dimargaris xerosporica]
MPSSIPSLPLLMEFTTDPPPPSHIHYRICATAIPSHSSRSGTCADTPRSPQLLHPAAAQPPALLTSTPPLSQHRSSYLTTPVPSPSPSPVPASVYVPLTLAADPCTPPRFSRLRQHIQTNSARIDLNTRILDQLTRRLDRGIVPSTDPCAAKTHLAPSIPCTHRQGLASASELPTAHDRSSKLVPSNAAVRVLKFASSPP